MCKDIHGYCSIYEQEGECENNEEWMRIYCKKACGFCKRSAQQTSKEPAGKAEKICQYMYNQVIDIQTPGCGTVVQFKGIIGHVMPR